MKGVWGFLFWYARQEIDDRHGESDKNVRAYIGKSSGMWFKGDNSSKYEREYWS